MKTKSNVFNEIIDQKVDNLLQNDAYYQQMATPLKSAAILKQEHRRQLVEFLKMERLGSHLAHAEKLIQEHLPHLISHHKFEKVKKEMDHSAEHLVTYLQSIQESKEQENNILFQDMCGVSDETLKEVYRLAEHFVKDKHYVDAQHILVWLIILAPDISGFWLALGICLQSQGIDNEAIEVFELAKKLNPDEPASYVYKAESLIKLKEKDKAREEIRLISDQLKGGIKGSWQRSLEFVNRSLQI